MFDVPHWSSDDEGVHASNFSERIAQPVEKTKKKKKKAKLQKSEGTNGTTMAQGMEKRKLPNKDEPQVSKKQKLSSSQSTINVDGQEVGGLLRRGIRFSSECELDEFYESKKKKKKKKKQKDPKLPSAEAPLEPNDSNSSSRSRNLTPKKKKKKSKMQQEVEIRSLNKEKDSKPNVGNEESATKMKLEVEKSTKEELKTSPVFNLAKSKLKSSQFRYINEKLYRQRGAQSKKMFSSDKDSFKIYHEGYAEQLRKWPKDPLNIIIPAILKQKPSNKVIADFGCGEARLAKSVSGNCKQIHSFDFVALNNFVTECDMASTPLSPRSVDIAVFCLSLMGVNLRDYLKEANRVLKIGGELMIAEVESRFLDMPVDDFIKTLERFGFKLNSKDLSHKFFYIMDFTKVHDCGKKVPEFSLKPCFYKKR